MRGNTWSSVFLVLAIYFVMISGLLALIYRIPVLKRHLLGEGVK